MKTKRIVLVEGLGAVLFTPPEELKAGAFKMAAAKYFNFNKEDVISALYEKHGEDLALEEIVALLHHIKYDMDELSKIIVDNQFDYLTRRFALTYLFENPVIGSIPGSDRMEYLETGLLSNQDEESLNLYGMFRERIESTFGTLGEYPLNPNDVGSTPTDSNNSWLKYTALSKWNKFY